jgi:hypothetical protein
MWQVLRYQSRYCRVKKKEKCTLKQMRNWLAVCCKFHKKELDTFEGTGTNCKTDNQKKMSQKE